MSHCCKMSRPYPLPVLNNWTWTTTTNHFHLQILIQLKFWYFSHKNATVDKLGLHDHYNIIWVKWKNIFWWCPPPSNWEGKGLLWIESISSRSQGVKIFVYKEIFCSLLSIAFLILSPQIFTQFSATVNYQGFPRFNQGFLLIPSKIFISPLP